uniref:Leucine-rich repeat-containing protein 74B-like n=1 Tax=Lepisosteus oculatus TaxID=7918 RepID=W5M6V8_LEPOC|nr:PREDICTED: leucine-rich repeat-containing protein 74B-like [Lepisosteus oculatus]
MVFSKQLMKESMLPSVLEVNDTEPESESDSEWDNLRGIGSRPTSRPQKAFSRGSTDNKTVSRAGKGQSPALSRALSSEVSREENVPSEQDDDDNALENKPADSSEKETVSAEEEWDTDLELEDMKEPYDPTGHSCYKAACKVFGVVPVSYFLRHMNDTELIMMHHGLGPQSAKALAVPLVTNTSILKLNLRDNWIEGLGGAAIAEMLKENCYITEIDLSENKLGERGAQALSSMLLENTTLVTISLSGNDFDDHAAKHLAEALVSNQKVESMVLSHNMMGDGAGETLGNAIAENTGLKTLNLSWNCLRGKSSIAVAKGLGANIFLRKLDLSYNGFGKDGAAALGEALKVNNVLEDLNISNNQIPPEGAVRFAMGLKENKTLKILSMSRNPMQSAGCYGILKSMEGNPESAIETLDFSDIIVNKDFDELYNKVKEMFPNLQVKHERNADSFSFKTSKVPKDPLGKLKYHIKKNNLKLEDSFDSVEEGGSALITRAEFQLGLKGIGTCLTMEEVQQLMDDLDKDNCGEIDFREFSTLLKKA